MKAWIQSINKYKWAILSGVLVGTSYIPFPPWAVLFCYAPLWWWASSEKVTLKEVFWGGWWTQFVLTLIGFHWIAHTAHEFAYMPWPLAFVVLFLFAALMHIYIPLALVLAKKFSGAYFLLAIPLLHSLAERFYPAIFQWHLGYVYHFSNLPIFHWADVIGMEGLSTLTLLFNATAVLVIKKWNTERNTSLKLAAGLAALFLVLNLSGYVHGQQWQKTDSEIRVSLIQANIGNLEKVYAEKGRGYQASIVDKFLSLTQKELEQNETDLVVWPETAFPDFLDSHLLERKHTKQLINGFFPLQTPLITGAYSKDPNSAAEKDTSTFNALFLVAPDGTSYSLPYRKTHLLAFGEYLPLSEQFPFLLKLLPFISNFGRGQGPSLLSLPYQNSDLHFGGQICYESLYPEFSVELAQKGAHVLINVTNDSWFGKTFEPPQHMSMTLARGIENRRPLIRSTNTGISTIVLASGKVLEQSPLHREWTHTYKLPYKKNPELTFFTRWGHLDYWIYLIVLLLIFLKELRDAKPRDA